MFPIQIIQDKTNPETKWLIRKENIDACRKTIYNVIPFHDYPFSKLNKADIKKRLNNNEINIPKLPTPILNTDFFRKLTPQEYFRLSKLFKNYKLMYNKKIDKLIEI